jgi:DNA (cytosine-5)-methyltransferase 1
LGGLAKAYNADRDMFPQAVRATQDLSPRAPLFENVQASLRNTFSDYFSYIVNRLTFPDCGIYPHETWQSHAERLNALPYSLRTGLKYRVYFKLLNAADFGVPQIRERVFIVGLRSDIANEWEWPSPSVNPSERTTVYDVLQYLPAPTAKHSLYDHVFIDGAKVYPGHTGSDIHKPSKTIKAGAHGVPGGENMIRFEDGSVRYMTVREAKMIQTFPRGYTISGAWGEAMRQIGNAVPVKLAKIIGMRLFSILCAARTNTVYPMFRTGTDGAYISFESVTPYSATKRKAKRAVVGI